MFAVMAALPATMLIIGGIRTAKENMLTVGTKQAKAKNSEWSKYDYLSLTNDSFPSHLKWLIDSNSTGSQMPREQKLPLIIELMGFFRAYSQGSYDSYRYFRTPPGVPFIWKTNKLGSLDNRMDTFRLPSALHRVSMDKKFYAYLLAANGNLTVYSNLFTGVCFEQSRIVIQKFNNPIPKPWETEFFPAEFKFPDHFWLSKVEKTHFPNAGYFSQKDDLSYIRFEKGIEHIVDAPEMVLVADCFFFIERRHPYPILPMIVRLYWDPQRSIWLPDDIVICDSVQESSSSMPLF